MFFSFSNEIFKNETIEKSGFSRRVYNISHAKFEREKKSYMINSLKKTPKMHIEPIRFYHKLVDLLAKNNINVFFYNMPTSSSILLLKENKSIEKKFNIIWEREGMFIKNEFPNSSYINFNKKGIEWELDDFSDRGHLNNNGASKLGKYITIDY